MAVATSHRILPCTRLPASRLPTRPSHCHRNPFQGKAAELQRVNASLNALLQQQADLEEAAQRLLQQRKEVEKRSAEQAAMSRQIEDCLAYQRSKRQHEELMQKLAELDVEQGNVSEAGVGRALGSCGG